MKYVIIDEEEFKKIKGSSEEEKPKQIGTPVGNLYKKQKQLFIDLDPNKRDTYYQLRKLANQDNKIVFDDKNSSANLGNMIANKSNGKRYTDNIIKDIEYLKDNGYIKEVKRDINNSNEFIEIVKEIDGSPL